jgi:hypothetical protein
MRTGSGQLVGQPAGLASAAACMQRSTAVGWRLLIQGLSVVMANTGVDVSWGRVTKAFEIIPVKGKPVKVRAAAAASRCEGWMLRPFFCFQRASDIPPACCGFLRDMCQQPSGTFWERVTGSYAQVQVSDGYMMSAAGFQHHAQRDAAGGHGTGAGLLARAAPRDRDGAGAQPRSAQGLLRTHLHTGCRAIPPVSLPVSIPDYLL